MNMRNTNTRPKSIQIMVSVHGRRNMRTARKYTCWLCDKECGSTADYLYHLQKHKDAIERKKI
jgi:hypothetical protein